MRGKTGRVYGDLMGLLTVMKGLPLAYNKDMQEDKQQIFDAIDTVKLCLPVFTKMLETATFRKDVMRKSASLGFINATDCADYLVGKGLPFREAYKIVGELVAICIEKGESFETLPLETYRSVSAVFAEDVYKAVDLDTCVKNRKVAGGPAESAVKEQIAHLKTTLASLKEASL